MPDALRFGAVILAAGPSSRMGAFKQLLAVGGRPLVVRAVQAALDSAALPVIVVVGAEADRLRPVLAKYPVQIAENPAWSGGMASSLRVGVSCLAEISPGAEAVLIALCDQPNFSASSIHQLVAAQRSTGCSLVSARYGGRNGVPALFLREHFAALCALGGDQGARALLNEDGRRVASVELPELAADIDTPADYAAAVRSGEGRQSVD